MVTTAESLVLGVVGACRLARFHAQRIGLRTDMSVGETAANIGELSDPGRLDLVLLTDRSSTRRSGLESLLGSGVSVAVVSPLSNAECQLARAISEAQLLVLSPGLADDDFQAALMLQDAGECREPLSLLHTTWGYSGLEREQQDADILGEIPGPVLDRLDQLLHLTRAAPQSVLAVPLAGRGDSLGVSVTVRLSGGVVARIDHHPSSTVTLSTGWVMTAAESGYHDFQSFTATSSGEVYGSPVSEPAIELDRVHDDLVRQWHDESYHAAVLEHARRLGSLVEAIERSVATGSESAC